MLDSCPRIILLISTDEVTSLNNLRLRHSEVRSLRGLKLLTYAGSARFLDNLTFFIKLRNAELK
jgi:hypothetical protein